jgi:hypothetical protein
MRKDKSLLLGLVCAVFALLQTQSTTATDAAAGEGGTVAQVAVARVVARTDTATHVASKPIGGPRAGSADRRRDSVVESSI